MKPPAILIAGLALAFVAGCDTKAPPGASIPDSVASKASVQATTVPKSDSTDTTEASKPPPPAPEIDRGKLPKSLQGDAYQYFGLGDDKPQDVQITEQPGDIVMTGSVANRLTKFENGVGTFEQVTTGGLNEKLGSQTLELRKDGIYLIHSDRITLDKPQLALPFDLIAGKSWSVDSSEEAQGRSVRQKISYVCQGETSVTSGGKTFKALLIAGKGTITGLDGKKSQPLSDDQWYVKNLGLVKEIQKVKQTSKGQKAVTLTMELQPTPSGGKK